MDKRRILVAGASGVIGASTVEAFAADGWTVLAASRRRPTLSPSIRFDHIALDLTDAARCEQAIADAGPVSAFVYAAVAEAPGLFPGWADPEIIALNARMFENVAGPLANAGNLRWAGLLQGTKAYGAHLHSIAVPAREDGPRDPHANFYWKQEDVLRVLAKRHGFDWTIFRPQIVFGGAPGAVMNPVLAIGAYGAICRELGRPFVYPSRDGLIWEVADASLLAGAQLWAERTPAASCQIYNVTNGDVFVLRDAWLELAALFALQAGEPRDFSIAAFFATPEAIAAWERLVKRHALQPLALHAFLGQSQQYLDLLLDARLIRAGGLPALVSTIKIRKAGFGDCRDSLESLRFWLHRLGETGLLPPDLVRSRSTDAAW